MSKHDFSLAEFHERQARVRKAMAKIGVDLLLVMNPVNIHWLIGARTKAYKGLQCLFFPSEPGPLTLLARLAEVYEIRDTALAEDVRGWGGREPEDGVQAMHGIMKEKGWLKRRVGLEVPMYFLQIPHYLGIKSFLGKSLVAEPSDMIADLKMVKSPKELEYIRKAAAIADEGLKALLAHAAEGKMECELSGEMHRAMYAAGGDIGASPMNFASGERTCYAHGFHSERRLKKGDFIQCEYGAVYHRYHATIGRQYVLGPPTSRMREVYDVVREAFEACKAEMRAGVPALTPHRKVKAIFAKAGLDRYRVHTTGYGIAPGYPPTWEEPIQMWGDDSNKYVLQAGMVMTVEPPVYIHEEKLGVRIIDNVLITATGCETLSKMSPDLLEL
ncbi:MAG: aminopeptidase P family protein [Rhodospirillales bacterium]|nr:aminopeptidase P family protein [Rhodospirillales bacterium]